MEEISLKGNRSRIGIFWLTPDLDSILVARSLPVEEGERYGDFLISPLEHYSEWEHLAAQGMLRAIPSSLRSDYETVPRGRVSYDTTRSHSIVYHGNWLQPRHRAMINARFRLVHSITDYVFDEHYVLDARHVNRRG